MHNLLNPITIAHMYKYIGAEELGMNNLSWSLCLEKILVLLLHHWGYLDTNHYYEFTVG